MVGSTTIDLEDRYYDSNWVDLPHKPIETRLLYHPDFEQSQGEVTLWVDIFDSKDKNAYNKFDITPSPELEFELRVIIWETEDIPLLDVEGTSDLYMTVIFNGESQATDMHFRCQNGVGSFNWRILLPVKYPCADTNLTVQAYDNDFFSRDDFISSNILNIKNLIEDAYELDVPIKVKITNISSIKIIIMILIPKSERKSPFDLIQKIRTSSG